MTLTWPPMQLACPMPLAGWFPDLFRCHVSCITQHLKRRGSRSYCIEQCAAVKGWWFWHRRQKMLQNVCLRCAEQGRALLHRRLLWGGEAGTRAAERGYRADSAQVSATRPVLQGKVILMGLELLKVCGSERREGSLKPTLLCRRELLRLPEEPKAKPPAQHQGEQQPKERKQKGRAHPAAAPEPGDAVKPATHPCHWQTIMISVWELRHQPCMGSKHAVLSCGCSLQPQSHGGIMQVQVC